MEQTVWSPRGSAWRRWDPHLHAPGTLLCDQFKGNWEDYLRCIEQANPVVEALGVTDYFSIRTYREVRKYKRSGRLGRVKLLFPNVEMRLDIKTAKSRPLNLHFLFSPDDPNHEAEIEGLLSALEFEYDGRPYRCTHTDLANLGRAVDASATTEETALRAGANQFKTSLKDIKALFRKHKWFRENCLIAVAGGSQDGTSGLQMDDSFRATRIEIEAFANIIFASTPKQRDFWLGKGPLKPEAVEELYGSLKPCLHGSDSHRQDTVLAPHEDRFCWLYGDLSFETLRQAIIEPDHRVWIGAAPPPEPICSEIIRSISVSEAPWLSNPTLELNSGLVTIIGARGSGKTALMDILAAAAGAMSATPSESSFLHRAWRPDDLLGDANATLLWGAGDSESATYLQDVLSGYASEREEQVRYLSQQFVERLCSSAGLGTELRREMERVVFESTEQQNRHETDCFDDLANTLLDPIREKRADLMRSIREIGVYVVEQEAIRDKLPEQEKEITRAKAQMEVLRKELVTLLPKESTIHAQALASLETLCGQAETKVESLRHRKKMLMDLGAETKHIRATREPSQFTDMQRRYVASGLTNDEWKAFHMVFAGNVDEVVVRAVQRMDQAILFAIEGDPYRPIPSGPVPNADWPLNKLKAARDLKKQEVGIDVARQKKYDDLQRELVRLEGYVRKLGRVHTIKTIG